MPVTGLLDQKTVLENSGAVSCRFSILKNRSDFLKAARALKVATGSFILQARKREDAEATGIRVGFTCSKKVGNAVARNRAKRRLREIARAVIPQHGKEGFDYVLIGRNTVTAEKNYEQMCGDLEIALSTLRETNAP